MRLFFVIYLVQLYNNLIAHSMWSLQLSNSERKKAFPIKNFFFIVWREELDCEIRLI